MTLAPTMTALPARSRRRRSRAAMLAASLALLAHGASAQSPAGWVSCHLLDGSDRLVRASLARSFPMAMGTCSDASAPHGTFEASPLPRPPSAAPAVDVWVVSSRARSPGGEGGRPPPPPQAFEPWLQESARRTGVSRALLAAVMFVESGYNPNARSNKGALGLMQVMPDTARRFGVADSGRLFDPQVNIEVAARYLSTLMEMFGGRVDLVVAAYNAGEGAVLRNGNRVPPFDETQKYVRKVLTLL